MILQLGDLQFETDTSYDELQRATGWRWEEIPILGELPVLHFSHIEAPTLRFKGTWWNYVATGNKMTDIEDIANEKKPLYLTDDQGKAYGFWVIEKFSVLGKFFRYGQEAPIKNAWNLEIKYYGENL